jgi:hypothetical protein
LGAGLTQVGLPASEASAPGPQTASIEYSSIDNSFGVLSGGQQRDFTTGLYGWQGTAFASLGMMGIEWTTATGSEARLDFSPDSGTASPSPGGDSSWTAPGYLSANPNNQIYTNNTISISGNQARFSQRHRSLSDESATNRRIYWVAELAAGYDPVFSGAGSSTLLISDRSRAHPTIIIHVTSAAGSPLFAGSTSMYTPLVDGDTAPTLYLAPGDATDFTMEITVGIVDADPCSASTAAAFAAAQAGTFGQVWNSLASCAEPASWSVTANGEASEPLSFTFQSPYEAPAAPVTRTLTLSGLPDGVEWERQDDEGTALRVSLTVPTRVEPGDYSLTWSSRDQRDEDGVITTSRSSSSTATLTVLSTPPPPPAPVEVSSSPSPPAESGTPSVPNSEVPVVIPEVPAPQPIAADPKPVTEVPSVIDPAPDADQSLPRVFDREPRRFDEPTVVIPEPLGAGAWLGIGTGVLAGGGILAALRRRFSKRRRAAGIEETRID